MIKHCDTFLDFEESKMEILSSFMWIQYIDLSEKIFSSVNITCQSFPSLKSILEYAILMRTFLPW